MSSPPHGRRSGHGPTAMEEPPGNGPGGSPGEAQGEEQERDAPEDPEDPEERWSAGSRGRHRTRAGLERLEELLPHDLKFLASEACNPDLEREETQVLGHMRSASKHPGKRQAAESRGCGAVRRVVGAVVYSWLVQTLVYMVILFDLTLIVISFASELPDGHTIYEVGDWLTVVVLSGDVMARFFVEGLKFLRSKMNLFELFLVPVTLVEVTLLKQLDLPVPILRAVRPVIRSVRLIRVFLRTLNKGKGYLEHLRHQVSGDRIRFTEDGFDLDLAYITSQLIAMSVPGVGRESILHNPHLEVARFLNERHGNKYLLLNTMEDRKYSTAPFFGRYVHFPIPRDGTPSLDSLLTLCQVLDAFLRADPAHILAVHSKHGQGRVGIVSLALLIYGGRYHTVNSAIAYYEHMRVSEDMQGTATTQTLDSASQRRLLDYFAHLCNARARSSAPMNREATLRRIQLLGLPNIGSVEVCCFGTLAPREKDRKKAVRLEASRGQAPEPDASIFELKALRDSGFGDTQDDDDEDIEEEVALNIPDSVMMSQVTMILEEASLDSRSAGCMPMEGTPVVSSTPGPKATDNISFRSLEGGEDDMVPGTWDISDTPLRGELRIEVHRRPRDTADTATEAAKVPKLSLRERLARVCMWLIPSLCCCCRRKEIGQATRFEGGMLFCCWLHTNYLELDESQDMPARLRPKNVVTVELDRFHLDKAANAPSLRSHSAALKLQIEFEVEQRVDLRTAGGAGENGELLLAWGGEASPPCPMGWLTWVSEKIWPSFQCGFEKLIRDTLLPNITESLPTPLKNIRLSQCSFGDAFPKFGPITACSRHHDGFEVQLDIELDYSTDANILLEHAMAHFGINYVSIKGILTLKFRPLLRELPVFAAMQLMFLNSPEVSLKFSTPGNITEFPMVKSVIFDSVDQALYKLLVLPNVMNINWGDPSNDSTLTFISVVPAAAVRIQVLEARDLHTDSRFKTLPDVQVSVSVGHQQGNTTVVSKSSNPSWTQEEFDFLVYDDRQHITAGVLDIDFTGRSALLGKVGKLSVAALVAATEGEQDGLWLDIQDTTGKTCGQVHLKAVMYNLSVDLHEVEKVVSDKSLELLVEAPPSTPRPESIVTRGLAGMTSTAAPVPDYHGGAVAVLICDFFGGRLPPELGQPGEVELRVGLGSSWDVRQCAEAAKADPGAMGEKTQQVVERLADRGLGADKIADALGEDILEVHRIMRKRGWNLEMNQKVAILVYPADLQLTSSMELALHMKGNCVARGDVPLNRLLKGFNTRFSDVVSCPAVEGDLKVDLDLEFRIFAMVRGGGAEAEGGL